MPLVISSSLVITEDETIPDGTPIILYENHVSFDNVSADSEDLNYPATNLANPATNQEWRGSADSPMASQVNIDVSINSVELIDAVGIARHNFGSGNITVTILSLDASSPPTETVLVGPYMPGNDEPLLLRFTAQAFVTLRIQFDLQTTAPRAAVLYAGPLLVAERGFSVEDDFVIPRFGRHTDAVNGRSERGDYLGRIVLSQYLESEIFWKHFTPDWYRENFDPFVEAAQRDTPFFIAWAPDDYPEEVSYCWLTDDPTPMTNPVTGRKSVTLKLGGIDE